jgi:hypothetical protein
MSLTQIATGEPPHDHQTDLINSRQAQVARDYAGSLHPAIDRNALERERQWLNAQFSLHGRAVGQDVLDRLARYRSAVAGHAGQPSPPDRPAGSLSVDQEQQQQVFDLGASAAQAVDWGMYNPAPAAGANVVGPPRSSPDTWRVSKA